MSLIEGYRLFTGNYIYESDLPSEAKLEFIQFLKEASGDDIIDVLEGQYEGVEGLTEDEMEALNTFIEEKFGAAWAATKGFVGRQAGRVGQQAGKAGRGVKKGLGYEKVARAKAAQAAAVKKAGGVPTKGQADRIAKLAAMRKKAVRGAVGRTALATGAVSGAGYGGYRGAKALRK